jgi:ETC complex I subunit conserved region
LRIEPKLNSWHIFGHDADPPMPPVQSAAEAILAGFAKTKYKQHTLRRDIRIDMIGPFMPARIYQPAKTAMQSGEARTKDWVLEFEPQSGETRDPLMGWTSSSDTLAQVRLEFDSKDDAIAYATRNGLAFTVSEPKPRRVIRKSYADNFKFGRIGSWTH